jgi:hypothetical protein
MKTSILNLFRNRFTGVATLVLVLMAGALGQSVIQLHSTNQPRTCGPCTSNFGCVSTNCVCVRSTVGGVCVTKP